MSRFIRDYNSHFCFFCWLSGPQSCTFRALPTAFLPPEALDQLYLTGGNMQGLAHEIADVEGVPGDVLKSKKYFHVKIFFILATYYLTGYMSRYLK